MANEQYYYYLQPLGAEKINLSIPWYSKIFKDAADNSVVQYLVHCDYAQAIGIDYLPSGEALQRLSVSGYDVLKKVIKGQDRFYYHQGILHALVVDFGLSAKYLSERATAYARLPLMLKENIVVVFLVFNDTKKDLIARNVHDSGLRIRLLKARWKY